MLTHTLGFPRIGKNRELKWAVEGFWQQKVTKTELLNTGATIRFENWLLQKQAGIDLLPVGDFSFYDQMLDMVAMLGAIPQRFCPPETGADLDLYFKMARGDSDKPGMEAMEMTKWFNTNYHYIVPEFSPDQEFSLSSNTLFEYFDEGEKIGLHLKPVLIGPFTFIQLGKSMVPGFNRWQHLEKVVAVYEEILARFSQKCDWIQLDEPILTTDIEPEILNKMASIYQRLQEASGGKIMLATYFGRLTDPSSVVNIPASGLHLDLIHGIDQLPTILDYLPRNKTLSLGIVDGTNIWRTEPENALAAIEKVRNHLSDDRIMVAPSCSFLHVPVNLNNESRMNAEILKLCSFAREKCVELKTLATAAIADSEDSHSILADSRNSFPDKSSSSLIYNQRVQDDVQAVTPDMYRRSTAFGKRKKIQQKQLGLPILPTTTIGSFPQTEELRAIRKQYRLGQVTSDQYDHVIQQYIRDAIQKQEKIGLDVLVHGEPERTDMVEYFAARIEGICISENGWVQSYGTRCVKPPIIYGDVSRPKPLTVKETFFAQSLTNRPVKGMLTGPVTMLKWSFVRDDQPLSATCRQLALIVRAEVADLEQAGIRIIQIDEPALREGMPLLKEEQQEYLDWAVASFRLASSGVRDETQIHTHMCYCEFNEIMHAIAAMDADVISIEASRSRMELLHAFHTFLYPNDIGPGIIDIHSPRVPEQEELVDLIKSALENIPRDKLWINPDCGLKTRTWQESEGMLTNMVAAARLVRENFLEEEDGSVAGSG